jgi:hypothetical protein
LATNTRKHENWSQNDATDTLRKRRDIEIDQQAEAHFRCPQTAEDLGLMNRMEPIDSLQFKQDLSRDDKIQPIGIGFSRSNGIALASSS